MTKQQEIDIVPYHQGTPSAEAVDLAPKPSDNELLIEAGPGLDDLAVAGTVSMEPILRAFSGCSVLLGYIALCVSSVALVCYSVLAFCFEDKRMAKLVSGEFLGGDKAHPHAWVGLAGVGVVLVLPFFVAKLMSAHQLDLPYLSPPKKVNKDVRPKKVNKDVRRTGARGRVGEDDHGN